MDAKIVLLVAAMVLMAGIKTEAATWYPGPDMVEPVEVVNKRSALSAECLGLARQSYKELRGMASTYARLDTADFDKFLGKMKDAEERMKAANCI